MRAKICSRAGEVSASAAAAVRAIADRDFACNGYRSARPPGEARFDFAESRRAKRYRVHLPDGFRGSKQPSGSMPEMRHGFGAVAYFVAHEDRVHMSHASGSRFERTRD